MNTGNQSSNQNPFGRAGETLQELMSLNMRTFQNFSYLNLEDFAQKNPEQIIERNINLLFSNGHKMISYLGEVFNIFETQFSKFSQSGAQTGKSSNSQSGRSERSNNQASDSQSRKASKAAGSEHSQGQSARKKREVKLDKTIESTFPASDAIAKY